MRSKWILCFMPLCVLLGCRDSYDISANKEAKVQEHTVAVVMPLGNGLEEHWRRTLGLLNRNMEIAFQGQDTHISLKYELFDEDSEDTEQLAEELAGRDDIEAVVGCLYSANAQAMIRRMADAGKPFFTMSTSATRPSFGWV